MSDERNWLEEEKNGDDALAEAMFARLMAEMPPIAPGADFVGRTVQMALRSRARRRLAERVAGIAAALLLGVTILGAVYVSRALAVGLITQGAALFSHGFAWLGAWVGREARWWWLGERIGVAISGAIGGRSIAAAVAASETIVLLSICAFHRLVLNEAEARKSRKRI